MLTKLRICNTYLQCFVSLALALCNATFAIYVCLLLPPDADDCLEAQDDDQPPAGVPVHPELCNPLPLGAEQGHHHLTGQSRSKTCRSQEGGRHQEAWGGVYSGSKPEVSQSKEDLMSPLPSIEPNQTWLATRTCLGDSAAPAWAAFSPASSVQLSLESGLKITKQEDSGTRLCGRLFRLAAPGSALLVNKNTFTFPSLSSPTSSMEDAREVMRE